VSYLQAQDGINSDIARQSWSWGAYFRVQHLPLDPENFLSRRSLEDRRRGLDGQWAKAAAIAIRAKTACHPVVEPPPPAAQQLWVTSRGQAAV